MARQDRLGFTLVELLVVIVIISMLVGLLLPAVQRSREAGRRAQCMNNQHELSLAMHQYETAIGRFPGYLNKMGTGGIVDGTSRQMPLSWVTVLLPHLGRQDLWREWRSQNVSGGPPVVRLAQAVCGSDTTKTDAASLSYVVNCGIQDGAPNDLAADRSENASDGVFFNLYGYVESGSWVRLTTPTVSSSSIRDGASNTLMLAENMQARTWYAADPTTRTDVNTVEPYLGFVWRWRSGATSRDTLRINVGSEDSAPSLPTIDCYNYARPSSNHPGVVIVSYCDGRQQVLSQTINYGTLRHLMTPNSTAAGLGTFTGDPELTD